MDPPIRRLGLLDTRRTFHLTQAQFADVLGIHANTYAKWERGEVQPTARHAYAVGVLGALAAVCSDLLNGMSL